MNPPLDRRTRTNMTGKGQVLIAKDVRDAIGLTPGQPVDVGVNDRGEAVVVPGVSAPSGTTTERRERLERLFAEYREKPLFDHPSDEIMRDLRGDEPLP